MPRALKTTIAIITLLLLATLAPLGIMPSSTGAQSLSSFTFIAYGDTRGSSGSAVAPIHSEIVTAYLQHNPDFVIHTGDMVNQGGIWNQWLSFNASIQPIWEAGIPLFGVVGNHEKYTEQYGVFDENFTQYRRFFNFSSVIDTPGETELHYSFDYGGVHFIILNTEDYFDYNTELFNCSQTQMDWLLNDLATTKPADFIVASYHRPAWSIRENREYRWAQAETIRHEFHQLFVQYGVDLVFCGHDHYYYHHNRDNIHYVVTGGGGASLYSPDMSAPHWQEGDITNQTYHYCKIEVAANMITVTVLKLDNITIDAFLIQRPPVGLLLPLEIQLLLLTAIIGVVIFIAVIVGYRKQ